LISGREKKSTFTCVISAGVAEAGLDGAVFECPTLKRMPLAIRVVDVNSRMKLLHILMLAIAAALLVEPISS
jgi:hypothetical protein